jgi:hypothetical protein
MMRVAEGTKKALSAEAIVSGMLRPIDLSVNPKLSAQAHQEVSS